MDRTIDRTKQSNRKCEHCKFYNTEPASMPEACFKEKGLVYQTTYWRTCKDFQWREEGDKHYEGRQIKKEKGSGGL